MNPFTSTREHRLWLGALAAQAAIYAAIPLAGTVSGFLRQRRLLEVSFFWIWVILVAALVLLSIRMRAGRGEVGAVVGVLAVYAMAWIRIELPEERSHLVEYTLVAVLIYQALAERRRHRRLRLRPAILAFVLTAVLGWVDEVIQALVPGRVYDIRDVGLNALAALMAVAASLALGWAWRKIPPVPRRIKDAVGPSRSRRHDLD